jgi:hypothetical protein
MRLQPYRHKGRTNRGTVTTLNLNKPIIMLHVTKLRRIKSKIKLITKTVKVKTWGRTNTTYQMCLLIHMSKKPREISPSNYSFLSLATVQASSLPVPFLLTACPISIIINIGLASRFYLISYKYISIMWIIQLTFTTFSTTAWNSERHSIGPILLKSETYLISGSDKYNK